MENTMMQITLIAMFITMIGFFMNLTKKVDAIKDELTDFKMTTNDRLTRLEMRMERVEHKLEEDKKSMILV